jgi:hypothetical protein
MSSLLRLRGSLLELHDEMAAVLGWLDTVKPQRAVGGIEQHLRP